MNLSEAKKELIKLHRIFMNSDAVTYLLVKPFVLAIEAVLKNLEENEN